MTKETIKVPKNRPFRARETDETDEIYEMHGFDEERRVRADIDVDREVDEEVEGREVEKDEDEDEAIRREDQPQGSPDEHKDDEMSRSLTSDSPEPPFGDKSSPRSFEPSQAISSTSFEPGQHHEHDIEAQTAPNSSSKSYLLTPEGTPEPTSRYEPQNESFRMPGALPSSSPRSSQPAVSRENAPRDASPTGKEGADEGEQSSPDEQLLQELGQTVEPNASPANESSSEEDEDDDDEPEFPRPRPTREIRSAIDTANIIEGKRIRKPSDRRMAYMTRIERPKDLLGVIHAFAIASEHTKPLHRDQLPPLPKTWRQLLKHPFKDSFIKAAETEFNELKARDTFKTVRCLKAAQVIPVKWVFTL
ncbi:hypothetical protein VTN02DRAFT_2265 [Thermoascus thermophilus]